MKKCQYCAGEIQDKAIKCKHCKEFLTQSKCPDCGGIVKNGSHFCSECGVIQISPPGGSNTTSIKNKILFLPVILTFISLLLFFAVLNNFSDTSKDYNASTSSSDKKANAQVMCREAIKKASKYGANPSIFDGSAVETGNVILVRFSDFEIGNAFGAKVQSTALCTYDIRIGTIASLRINKEKIF